MVARRWPGVLWCLGCVAALSCGVLGQTEDETPAAAPAEAVPAKPAVPEELQSPRATVHGFLEAHADWQESPSKENSDRMLRHVPRDIREALDRAGVKPTDRLGDVLGQLMALQWWPPLLPEGDVEAPEYTFSLTVPEWAEPAAFKLVRDEHGAWSFSHEAMRVSGELHAELFSTRPEYRLRNIFIDLGMERLVTNRLLGVRYYQWISLFTIIVLGVTLDLFFRAIVMLISRRFLKKEEDDRTTTDARLLIRRSARPFGLVAGGLFVYLMLPILQLPVQAEGILLVAAKAFTLIAGVGASFRVVDIAGEWAARRAARTESHVDDLLIPLIRRAAKIFLLAFGLVFIAESLNLPIASLIAGFGIAGAAIAFASKDTIENLFGSVAVIMDRPFHAGDWVEVGDVEGIVESLGFRSTRIRTFYNSLVTMPNATLVRAKVDNFGRRRFRRFKTTLNITYSTPPDRIEAFCEGIREIIRQHPYTRKDFFEVHMNSFGPHSLDVLVYMFFLVPDWSVELRERHRFCLDIIRLAHRLGVEFAFPTQTIHMAREAPDDGGTGGSDLQSSRRPEDSSRELGRKAADEVMADADFRRDAT